MDKVIDGVDVSGCEFSCENPLHEIKHSCNIRGYEKDNGLHIHLKCKNNPNCYYKQLKRLERQYENVLKIAKENADSNEYCLQELEQENERLKEEIKQYKKYKFLFEKAKEFKEKTDKWASKCLAENEDLKDTIKRTVCQAECFRYKQANNYKQALQEIREIFSHLDENNWFHTGKHIYMDDRCINEIKTRILDKINEVIGAENEIRNMDN